MRCLRSRWSRVVVVVVLLLGALAVWHYWIANALGEKEWQAYVARERERGVKFSIAELRPPPVPRDEDLSALPIFQYPAPDSATAAQIQALTRLTNPMREKRRPDGGPRLPDWNRTRKAYAANRLPVPADEPDDIRAIRAGFAALEPLIEQLHTSRASSGNWPQLWSSAESPMVSMELDRAAGCATLLMITAWLDLAEENPARALAGVHALMRLSQSLDQAPGDIARLTQIVVLSRVVDVVWLGLEHQAWDEAALREFITLFLAVNQIRHYQWTLETERVSTHEHMERLLPTGVPFGASIVSSSMVGRWWMQFQARQSRWWRANQKWLHEFFQEEQSTLDPERQVWNPRADRRYDATKPPREYGVCAPAAFVCGVRPAFTKLVVHAHATAKMAAIACALELSRKANGRYPEQLTDLVPAYLPELPAEPCVGGPFRFKTNPNGSYLLYSIGANFQDDGGTAGDESAAPSDMPDWRWWAPRRAQ